MCSPGSFRARVVTARRALHRRAGGAPCARPQAESFLEQRAAKERKERADQAGGGGGGGGRPSAAGGFGHERAGCACDPACDAARPYVIPRCSVVCI
eukprot:SAG11_NODE_1175_length_5601_cov_15.947110_7_plen_97_part_00